MSKPNAGKPGAKLQSTEDAAPAIAISRKAPPAVQPLVFEGVRYEQVMDATTIARDDQPTGYLAAYDESNDRLLWYAKIYTVEILKDLEKDVQEVYFASMSLDEVSRTIHIENEHGDRFLLSIDTRKVQPVR